MNLYCFQPKYFQDLAALNTPSLVEGGAVSVPQGIRTVTYTLVMTLLWPRVRCRDHPLVHIQPSATVLPRESDSHLIETADDRVPKRKLVGKTVQTLERKPR